MAKKLIASMSAKWHPEMFKDDYHRILEKVVQEKIQKRGKKSPAPKMKRKPSNVIDLVSVLQESINASKGKSKSSPKARKKAA